MRSKRCSTISTFSQDSGFTSQDTFSIRSQDPSSPQKTRGAQLYCRGYTTGGSPLHPYSTIRRSQSPFQTGRAPHYSAPLTGRPPLPRRRPPPPPRCSSLDRHSGQLEGEEGAKSQDSSSRPQSQLSQTHKAKACQSELSSPAHAQRTSGGGLSHSQRSCQAPNGRDGTGEQNARQSLAGGGVAAAHYSAPSNNSLVPPPPRPFPSIRQNGQSKFHFRESSTRPS